MLNRFLLLCFVLTFALAVSGGLARMGVLTSAWPSAVVWHGPLLFAGFFTGVIGLERAVGLSERRLLLGPAAALCGSACLLAGLPGPASAGYVVAAFTLVFACIQVCRLQRTPATATMLAGSLAGAAGTVAWSCGSPVREVVLCWLTFVVLTIAGERLELAFNLRGRLVPLWLVLALVAGGLGGGSPRAVGLAFVLLALWLSREDVARRTVRGHGLPRFIGFAVLLGLGWLAVTGLLLVLGSWSTSTAFYGATIHALSLGFVVTMVLAHAPIVVPAVLKTPALGPTYPALWILQFSVLLRVAGDLLWTPLRAWAGMLHVLAFVAFAAQHGATLLRSGRAPARPRPGHAH